MLFGCACLLGFASEGLVVVRNHGSKFNEIKPMMAMLSPTEKLVKSSWQISSARDWSQNRPRAETQDLTFARQLGTLVIAVAPSPSHGESRHAKRSPSARQFAEYASSLLTVDDRGLCAEGKHERFRA